VTLILVASVGGSPAPIVTAVASLKPDRVLFVATPAEAGRPGSRELVPGILEASRLPAARHAILDVPPDDPEPIFLALRERVRALRAEHPGARFLFDYTGGTKSMTAALFQCALATPGARLQFMAGRRDTLDRIADGTERPTEIDFDWLIAERTETRLRSAWAAYDYAACAQGARALSEELGSDEKAPPEARRRLADLGAAAEAFDLWDRFRHAKAASALETLASRHPALEAFARDARLCARHEWARLADLLLNAQRCAARGRYDDAVARCYRLVEWTGQWRLKEKHGIDTGAVDWERVSEAEAEAAEITNEKGKKTLSGLVQTLRLLAAKEPGGVVDRFLSSPWQGAKDKRKRGLNRLRDMLELRNHSILAHGEAPLTLEHWEKWTEFLEAWRRDVMVPLLREAGLKDWPSQLPKAPPDTL
jgi:hypothetical protein